MAYPDPYEEEDEGRGLGRSRPVAPPQVMQEMSSDEEPASLSPEAAEFPKLPQPPEGVDPFNLNNTTSEARSAGMDFLRSQGVSDGDTEAYESLKERYARENATNARRAQREADAEQDRQARAAASAETKQLREQGVKMTVDDQNRPIPATGPDGSRLYEPGWSGDPRFDESKKAWVRDRRDETGQTSAVDLWENGDISRDSETGDLYFEQGGVRNVVGKDEDYLRKRAIGSEIRSIAQQKAEAELESAKIKQSLKPLKATYEEKKKSFEDVSTRLQNIQRIAESNPKWADANAETFRAAHDAFTAAQKDFQPLQSQFQAAEKREAELDAENLKRTERTLSLYSERNALDAARSRPEFTATAPAPPEEAPATTAERETHGIGGEAYQIPDLNLEALDFRLKMSELDFQAKQLAPATMVLQPDTGKAAGLSTLNETRKELVREHMARRAVLEKHKGQTQTLTEALSRNESSQRAKSAHFNKAVAALEQRLQSGQISPREHDAALRRLEKPLLSTGKERRDLQDQLAHVRKTTTAALQSGDELPATLLKDGDLDPSLPSLRAAGRAAAFGTSQAAELYETLEELKATGRVKSVGGQPIDKLLRQVGGQKNIRPADLLTSDEKKLLQLGLRGPLITEARSLLGPSTAPALEGKDTLSTPDGQAASPEEFWRQRTAHSLANEEYQKSAAEWMAKNPGYQQEILTKRDAIRNREPKLPEDYAALTPAAQKKLVENFQRKKAADLAAFDQKQLAMGGDRAALIQSLQGQNPESTGEAFVNELTGRVRAAVYSPTAGIWQVGAGLLDTLAILEATGNGSDPEESGLRRLAVAAREGTQDLMGDKSDSLLAQVGQGVGSSLAFAPAAMLGGLPAVAALGASQAFGPGYFEAKEKSQAAGIEISETQAMLNGLLGMGLGATEGLPIARAMNRLDRATGGSLKRLIDIGKETAEEALQESFQTVVQGFADKLQSFNDKDWKQILGEGLSAGAIAGLSGLLMGVAMNAAGERAETRQTARLRDSFSILDQKYNALRDAARSPEALASFNLAHPDSPDLSEASAADMVGKLKTARNQTALELLTRDHKALNATLQTIAPRGDRSKLAETIRSRPGVLAEAHSLGRDLGALVSATWNNAPASPLKNVIAGHLVLNHMDTLLKGGNIPAALGQALEAQGYLIRKPTGPEGQSSYALTGPALSLLDGDTRRAVAKAPEKFAYAPEADTAAAGSLTAESEAQGDRQISKALNPEPAPASVPPPSENPPESSIPNPESPGSFIVTLQSEPDAAGFTTNKTIQVQADSAEVAGQAAIAQAQANKWPGQWTPIQATAEKSPDSEGSEAYSQANETPSTTQPGSSDSVGDTGSGVPASDPNLGQLRPDRSRSSQDDAEGSRQIPADDGRGVGSQRGETAEVGGQGESQGSPDADAQTSHPRGPDFLEASEGIRGESPTTALQRVKLAWDGRGEDLTLLRKALAKVGVRVTKKKGKRSHANPHPDGTITLNLDPDDFAVGTGFKENAGINEEILHAAGFLAKRKEWIAAGKKEDFVTFMREDAESTWAELMARLDDLPASERPAVETAIVGSFNSYFLPFKANSRPLRTAAEIDEFLAKGGFGPDKNYTFSFIHELARQMAQLRAAGSVTEETHSQFLDGIIQWVRDAIASLRNLLSALDDKGGALDGTQIKDLIRALEAEYKWIQSEIDRFGHEEMAETNDYLEALYASDPIIEALVDMGGILSRTAARKAWSKDKFAANKSIWDDAPKFKNPRHNSIYNPTSGLSPDEAATALSEQGLLEPGAAASDLWAAVEKIAASDRRQRGLEAKAEIPETFPAGPSFVGIGMAPRAEIEKTKEARKVHAAKLVNWLKSTFPRPVTWADDNGWRVMSAQPNDPSKPRLTRFISEPVLDIEPREMIERERILRELRTNGPGAITDTEEDFLRETWAKRSSHRTEPAPVGHMEYDSIEEMVGDFHNHLNDKEATTATLFAKPREFRNASLTGPGEIALYAKRAHHGTPHKVDRFSLDKIGTGEGAQAYGWGLYFAESHDVADGYRQRLSKPPALSKKIWDIGRAAIAEVSVDGIANPLLEKRAEKLLLDKAAAVDTSYPSDAIAFRKAAEQIRVVMHGDETLTRGGGNTYTVELDVESEDLLDWDKPISEQSDKVQAALGYEKADAEKAAQEIKRLERKIDPETFEGSSIQDQIRIAEQTLSTWDRTGQDIYGRLASSWGAASGKLASYGIPGIRYLDGQSRNKPLKDIKREFLSELPEDAEIEDVGIAIDNGQFSGDQTRFLRALEADDWLGFDYPAQAISAALSRDLSNYDASDELKASIKPLFQDVTYNYVIFDESKIRILEENGKPVSNEVHAALMAKPRTSDTKEKNSTQINIPPALAKPFLEYGESIPESDLYTAEEGYGREDTPHVTVLYGLETTPSAVQNAAGDQGTVTLRFGKTSLFESEDKPFDVLKVDVKGPDIRKLNALLQREFPTKSDFPDYRPHLTIAYVKKGRGKKYAGDPRFEGIEAPVSEFVFSDQERNHIPISLSAKPREAEIGASKKFATKVGVPRSLLEEATDGISRTLAQIRSPRLAEAYQGDFTSELFTETEGASTSGFGAAPETDEDQRRLESSELAAGLRQAEAKATRTAIDRSGGRISSLFRDLVNREIPGFNIVGQTISTPADFAVLTQTVRSPFFESLKVAFLDDSDRVLHSQILHVGTLNESVLHSRDILMAFQDAAEQAGSTRVLISHNHPSGDPNPSGADIRMTKKIRQTLGRVGLELVDHVITNGKRFYSFESGFEKELPWGRQHVADWEAVPRDQLRKINSVSAFTDAVAVLRQGDPGHMHAIYTSTKNGIIGVERLTARNREQLQSQVARGLSREGAYGFFIDFGNMPKELMRENGRALSEMASDMSVSFLDAANTTIPSLKESGLLEDSGLYAKPMVSKGQTGFDFALDHRESSQPGLNFDASQAPTPAPETHPSLFGPDNPQIPAPEVKKTPAPRPASPPRSGALDDFGEKLGGARKDQTPSLQREYSDSDLAGKPLSEIWPKAEVEAIEDLQMAALAQALRSEVPAKPRKGYKLNRWVETVKTVRTLMLHAERLGFDTIMERLADKSTGLEKFSIKVRLLSTMPRSEWNRLSDVHWYPNAIRYGKDGEKIGAGYAGAKIDGRSIRADTLTSLAEKIGEAVAKEKPSSKMAFEVRGRGDSYKINKKGDPLYRPLKTFTTTKEAFAYINDHRDDLEQAWEDLKKRENVRETDLRRKENRPRTGADHRQGRDVTPEMFTEAFGFRGVEFGNWVAQGKNSRERQGMLNQAFDALMDLAAILKVPTKALSLNGELGLGSRGKGWASAHYEPDRIVINLTKTRGSGSLAHEFFHALDHYFQRARGESIRGNRMAAITQNPGGYYQEQGTGHVLASDRFKALRDRNHIRNPENWIRTEGVRPEVEDAFHDLVKTLDDSPMAERARRLDKGSRDYWGSIIERAARAFENYTIHKMSLEGYDNDYLANVTTLEEFSRSEGSYPYLKDDELAPVAEAFEHLFATLKTKETDQGIALYAKPRQEAVDLLDRIQQTPVVRISTEQTPTTGTNKELRNQAIASYSGPSSVVNTPTRNQIKIEPSGLKTSLRHGMNVQKRALIPFLDRLLENAAFVVRDTEEMNQGVRAVETYAARVSIDENPFVARLIVREVQDGRRFYDHELSDVSAVKSARPAGYSRGSESAFASRHSKLQTRASLGKRLIEEALSVNPDDTALFAKPRLAPQGWFDFAVDVTQRDSAQIPLTLADGMRDATAEQNKLFHGNVGLAYKIAGDYQNAGELGDLRQEALIAMTRAVKTYRPQRGKFSTWAGTIIRNHLNSVFRHRPAPTESLEAELGESGRSLEDLTPGSAEAPSITAERQEAIGALHRVIASLPTDLREVITKRLQGLTQQKIGEQRGVRKQTISNMEKVAMGLLRSRLAAQGIDGIPLYAKPRAQRGQEDFLGPMDKEIFPSMVDQDKSVPPPLATSPSDAEAIAQEILRDARGVADGIENPREEDEIADTARSTIREQYTRHLRGRYDKLNYFSEGAGDVLLDANRSNADFAAAFRKFTDGLENKIKASFGYPSWWRKSRQRARMSRFKAELLPYAAALNPIRRDGAGDFVFEDFWQRAGERSGIDLERMNRAPGEEWIDAETNERWRVSGYVVPDPAKPEEGFYQLERFIPAASQGTILEEFHDRYPEAAFLLDDFIEPGQEAARTLSPQDVALPTFNRHSLYGFYGDTPAGLVEKLPGYTPDVTRTKSIAGFAAKVLKIGWQSPGRDYKSGQARVTGQVRDLLEGFNLRAAQAHMETTRREMAEKLLKATVKPVPESGIPPEYARLDRDTLNPLIRAMRHSAKKGQSEMPELMATATDQLTQRDQETLRFLFGDPSLFDPNLMIHREVLSELERGFVRLRLDNEFLDGAITWIRGSVAGVLADFQTFSINKISNYLFHTLRASQRTASAAIAYAQGDKRSATQSIREAGYLMTGFFTNFYHPAIRERMNDLVPPEVFEEQNIIRQLMGESADMSITDLLRQANVGGAVLKAVGYGNMDVRAKQKIALASLMARASIAADDAGVLDQDRNPGARKAWMHEWIKKAPVEARREAELAAKLYLMDYANVPWWLDNGRKIEVGGADVTPWVNLIRSLAIPFWKYPYNYLRQMKRLGRDSVRTLTTRRKTSSAAEKREAGANLTAVAMLTTAYWLLTKPWGDDDDEEILGQDLTADGEKMDPKLRTSSRVRLSQSSIIGNAIGTAARLFGAGQDGTEGEEELWARVRTMPYATQAMFLGATLRWMADPQSGNAKQAVNNAGDLLEDFMSIGSGARIGTIMLGYRDDYTRYQDSSYLLGQGFFDLLTSRVLPPRAMRDISNIIDPINRRSSQSKSLDYIPGASDGIIARIPGATKLLPPSGRVQTNADPNSATTIQARTQLQALGLEETAYREYLDEKTGKLRAAYVRPDRLYKIPKWKALVRQLGFNVKPVPRQQYQDALAGVDEDY